MIILLLTACSGMLRIESTDDLAEACETYEPEPLELTITFEKLDEGCPFGEDDNLPEDNGYFTARIEQDKTLDLPEGAIICDLEFDFEVNQLSGQSIEYDDNFVFTFNDVVLAASYGRWSIGCPKRTGWCRGTGRP